MDYVRSQPDAGHRTMPYAKSDSARQWAIVILAVVGVVGFIGGPFWAIGALVLALPLLWRLEHHFFLRRRETDAATKVDDSTDA